MPAITQVFEGKPGAPGTLEFPDSRVLPIPTPPFIGDIQPNLINSTPGWPSTIARPKGAPNVLLILIDAADYKPPFPLTAKLNKPTIKVDRPTLSPADIKKLEGAQAEALDGKPLTRVQPGPQ
jgi:hypothetical protein